MKLSVENNLTKLYFLASSRNSSESSKTYISFGKQAYESNSQIWPVRENLTVT